MLITAKFQDRQTICSHSALAGIQMATVKVGRYNKRHRVVTIVNARREAEADIAHAKDGTELLDCLYVMETGMRYFFMRAQTARNVKGNEAVVRANMLEAVEIAEKIAPYRHHKLAAIKLNKTRSSRRSARARRWSSYAPRCRSIWRYWPRCSTWKRCSPPVTALPIGRCKRNDPRGPARRYRLPFLQPSPPCQARTHHDGIWYPQD